MKVMMVIRPIVAASLVLVLSACGAGWRAGAGGDFSLPESKGVQALPEFPALEKWRLPNGLEVRFLRDEELPVVSGTLFIRGGSLWDAPDHIGVSSAMGEQMRLGGAGELSADALDERLEELSAVITSSFGQEFGRIAFSSLSADFKEIMGLLSDVTLRPRFEDERLTLWKAQALEGVRRRKDNPSTIGSVSFSQVLFYGSPYGAVSTSSSISEISRLDLLRAHRRWLQPARALLAVTGNVSRAEVEAAVSAAFGDWTNRTDLKQLEPPPAPVTPFQKTIFFIEQPLEQATILIGQQGVPRLTEDQFAIEAFNNIFGSGGFGSRLMKRVRTELGLAYVVYGGISPGVVRGRNLIFIQTKTDAALSSLEASLATLTAMASDEVPAPELEETRESLQHAFVFNFESPEQRLFRMVQLELLGYPSDYDEQYVAAIRDLSASQVREVGARRWNFSEFTGVVVADPSLYPQLEQWLSSNPPGFEGFTLRKASFDEVLQLP